MLFSGSLRQISAPVKLTLADCVKASSPKSLQVERPMMRRETKAHLLQHASTCPGGRLMIPWPEYLIELFREAKRDMPFVALTESHYRLLCGSSQVPHPQKAHTGGEDSFFICPNGSAAGEGKPTCRA